MAETINHIQKPMTPELPKTEERLSDEKMGNLLSGAGNHEAKLITLILMGNGDICDRTELYRRIINSQGEIKEWKMSKLNPFKYCSNSLAPIGLVTYKTIDKHLNTWGYQITPYGEATGIPLAGLLLDFSERHNIPLNRFLGATTSGSQNQTTQTKQGEKVESKNRATSTTLKILRAIVKSSSLPIREVDIVKAIGEDDKMIFARVLTRLSELGLAEYDSTEVNKPFSSYRLSSAIPEGKLPIYRNYKNLTQLVFNILKENQKQDSNKYLTRKEIYDLIPQEQKERSTRQSLISSISNILSSLNKDEYADIEKFDEGKQSEISITEQQRAVLTEFLEIIDGVQNQDPEILEKGTTLAEKIIADSNKVSKLLGRAKEASPYANQSPREETKKNILSIIRDHPNGITNKRIRKLLGEQQSGKTLSLTGIQRLSGLLQKENYIRIEKQGRVKIFFPNNPPPASS